MIVASLFEIIPTFLIQTNIPTIASVKPYTPLELAGRDIYQREGCFNCHSQMVRPVPLRDRALRRVQQTGRVRVRPSVPVGLAHWSGSRARRRQNSTTWHVNHMKDPRKVTPNSIMPRVSQLLTAKLDFPTIQKHVDAMAMLGVPYGDMVKEGAAVEAAKAQAAEIAADIAATDPNYTGLEDKEITARRVPPAPRRGHRRRTEVAAARTTAGGQ